jgi:hypothetical protein
VRKEINVDPAALGRVVAIPSNLQSLSQPEWTRTEGFRARTKHPGGAQIHVEGGARLSGISRAGRASDFSHPAR